MKDDRVHSAWRILGWLIHFISSLALGVIDGSSYAREFVTGQKGCCSQQPNGAECKQMLRSRCAFTQYEMERQVTAADDGRSSQEHVIAVRQPDATCTLASALTNKAVSWQ